MKSTRWITVPKAYPIPPGFGTGEAENEISFWNFLSLQVLTRPFWRKSLEAVAAGQRLWRLFEGAKEGEQRELALTDWQWLSEQAQLADIQIAAPVLPAIWHHQTAIYSAKDGPDAV